MVLFLNRLKKLFTATTLPKLQLFAGNYSSPPISPSDPICAKPALFIPLVPQQTHCSPIPPPLTKLFGPYPLLIKHFVSHLGLANPLSLSNHWTHQIYQFHPYFGIKNWRVTTSTQFYGMLYLPFFFLIILCQFRNSENL